MSTAIHWFRRDLRLDDNPSWELACKNHQTVLPIYIHNPQEDGKWTRGEASNWWLHHALADLSEQLEKCGSSLIILSSNNSLETLQQLIDAHDVEHIYWNRCYEPAAIARDTEVKKSLTKSNINVTSCNGSLLFDPLKITNKSGTPFKVFTPFWKHLSSLEISPPHPSAKHPNNHQVSGDDIDALNLLPEIPWDTGMQESWDPTRLGGLSLLADAIEKSSAYNQARDTPALDGTSRLSPYLHFGQIGPREFYHSILTGCPNKDEAQKGILRQLFWREFSAHLLYHFPHSQDEALKPEYQAFPWKLDEELVRKWQRGKTGFPIVDAGMRQLWHTGWMHNRVRMITASFLVKHLLQPWQEGAWWFWDTLVDADLANNTMGWQWIAGCGADASPYFRIFNPIIQGKKFDPKGDYIRRWLPELQNIPNSHIHTPWEMEPFELISAGIRLDSDYPSPIIPHEKGRQQALDAYQHFKNALEP